VIAVALIGGLDEIHQSTLPGRKAEVRDFLTDAAAAALTTYLPHRFGRSPPVYTGHFAPLDRAAFTNAYAVRPEPAVRHRGLINKSA